MLMIVYKALNGQAPSYTIELLNFEFQTHGHNLRSTQDTLALQIPQIRTQVTLGDRSFICGAPRLWNKLPVDIRKSQTLESFKSKVKPICSKHRPSFTYDHALNYTGWPRKNATILIVNFKDIVNKTNLFFYFTG